MVFSVRVPPPCGGSNGPFWERANRHKITFVTDDERPGEADAARVDVAGTHAAGRPEDSHKARSRRELLRIAPQVRAVFISFWVVVMPVIWLPWGQMALADKWIFSAWSTLFAGGGLVGVYLLKRKLLREERQFLGCCLRCGYDLRATPGRCPECGTPVAG